MKERMRTFVVPEALDQSTVSSGQCCFLQTAAGAHTHTGWRLQQLRPYVAKAVKIHEHQDSWPMADTKPDKNSRKGGTFGPRGFDGHYYIQLAKHLEEQEQAKR